MTLQIPNPSFIIINSLEQENTDLLQFIEQNFRSPTIFTFDNIPAYLASDQISDPVKVCILFENCFNLSLAEDCEKILTITSNNATIVLGRSVEYFFTQQLIDLGICEILLDNNYNADQLRQSIFSAIGKHSRYAAELAASTKNQFFDVLSKYYGSLVASVDFDLNFYHNTNAIVNKFQFDCNSQPKKNLRDYVHKDDLWQLNSIANLFQNRKVVIIHPLRLKCLDGTYQNYQASFFKDEINPGCYILDLKDFENQQYKDDFRRENNERFSAIAEATNSIVYEFFFQSKLLFTANNKGIYGMIENQHLEDYYKQYYDRIHPEDRERVANDFSKSAEVPSREPFATEYRILKSNGRYKTILDRYHIFFQDGVAYKRIGARTDITLENSQNALKELEKQVYELNADPNIDFSEVISYLEDKMEELIPSSKCMILTMGPKNRIESVSKRTDNNQFLTEIGNQYIEINPLCAKTAQRGKMSESENWIHFESITQKFGYNYFWTTPAINKDKETIANVVVLLSERLETEEMEEILIGRVTVLVGMLVAKNKALTETKASRERYEIVAKATSDTIWDWNVQTDDFSWNKGIYQIFGYTEEEVGATSNWWFSHVHPEDSIRVSVKLYNFLEEKVDKWQDEYRFACADGTYRYVFDRGFLEKDSTGKPLRMIGAMQDITQQKKEEERLKLLSAAITQANDAVIITETPRSIYAIPKIVYVNPAFSKMTGYQYDEVVGKPPTIFIGKNAMVEQQTILSKANEFNKEFIFEAINRRKDGEEYWARFSMIPVADGLGEHSHWISIQSDISEQKEQEKEKEQLIQELTRNNNDLKQFSYITSHNLRAPLSNLIGLLNLIEDIEIEDEDLKEIIEGFSKSTHLLNQTINDLIKIVIIKDNLSIEKEQIKIQDIIQNILDQLGYTLSMYSPKINIKIANAPVLFVNKSYIESIFLNLITNAMRYSDPDRKLEIDISSQIVGNETVLIFKDNGVGIDLDRNREKIFGLYQRFHDFPDSKGLGLYLVKSQVLSMGGSISVESELGRGSSFIISFKNQQ